MIDDGIEHQPEVSTQALYIGPGTKGRIDLGVINYGESVVGGVGEERQDVDARYGAAQGGGQDGVQGFQRRCAGLPELVAVGDEDGVLFGKWIGRS